jgi:hypothetical protein
MSGIGGPTNAPYYVLSSTNLSVPVSAWTRLATNVFSAAGTFSVTNSVDSLSPQKFYLLQLP